MSAPLVPWRRTGYVVVVAAAACLITGAVLFHHSHQYNPTDLRLLNWTRDHFSHAALHDLVHFTAPEATTSLIALIAVIALVKRQIPLAITAVLGPILAIVLTEVVFKPLVGRTLAGLPGWPPLPGYAYPSGHESGVASLTAVLVLAVFVATRSLWLRLAAILGALALDLLAALALVGNQYHYASDTLAAIALSVACVVGVALVVDARTARRVSSPDAGSPASTAHAA